MDTAYLDETLNRYNDLYTRETGTIIITSRFSWGKQGKKHRPLESWNFPAQWKAYMDFALVREQAFWEERAGIADDLIPAMRPFYGIAEHSSFFGGRVDYGGDTSYHHPVIDSLDDVASLHIDEQDPHYRMLLDSMTYLKERQSDSGLLVSLRGAESPLDIANALRGNDLFLDMYDRPEDVHRLVETCARGLHWNLENQLRLADRVHEGVIAGLGVWMPGRSVGHISEDTSSMCSAAMYEEFGFPYSKNVLSEYEGVCIHIHTMGAHVLPLITQLDNLLMVQIEADPNQPSPLAIFRAHESLLRDTIVMMRVDEKELYDSRDFLRDKRTILQVTPSSDEQAREIISFVRQLHI